MSITRLKLKSMSRKITLPDSGRTISIRPYSVGEEMGLLTAKESKSAEAYVDAISTHVRSVTSGSVDSSKDSYIDVIYAFMIAKSLSAGEVSQIKLACDCGKSEDFTVNSSIDVTKIQTEKVNRAKKIDVDSENGKITFNLRPIPFDAFAHSDGSVDASAKLFRACVVSIVDESGEKIEHETSTEEEWLEFYSSFPAPIMSKIVELFETKPKAWYVATGTCSVCGKTVEKTLEGLANFL